MNNITITEALVAGLVERGGVDASNIIQLLRNAQINIAGTTGSLDLNTPMDIDEVDDIIIMASHNGHVDLFAAPVARA